MAANGELYTPAFSPSPSRVSSCPEEMISSATHCTGSYYHFTGAGLHSTLTGLTEKKKKPHNIKAPAWERKDAEGAAAAEGDEKEVSITAHSSLSPSD